MAEPSVIHSDTSVPHLGHIVKLVFKQVMVSRPAVYEENRFPACRIDIFYINFYIVVDTYVKSHSKASVHYFYNSILFFGKGNNTPPMCKSLKIKLGKVHLFISNRNCVIFLWKRFNYML
ncbi:hypothetical protein KL86CLO1_11957 [uncultured Eubacteriales bacterium]|uniref:Uncharacterized protein n=1 Tax=uncultured Eubacteriales bacterium TaxID=172733 RepID=A0A212JZL9_9FIRM|nr:hypothetical protein KL86CLO1_11957 [uncultured Eubacteriales bacterium]